MRAHSRMEDGQLGFEVNRYLGWPGQAPSYKVGERIWLQARDQVKAKQGPEFDLKRVPHRRPRPGLDRARSTEGRPQPVVRTPFAGNSAPDLVPRVLRDDGIAPLTDSSGPDHGARPQWRRSVGTVSGQDGRRRWTRTRTAGSRAARPHHLVVSQPLPELDTLTDPEAR